MIFEHAVSMSAEKMPTDARIYMCDWDESRGELQALRPGCPVIDKGPSAAGLNCGRFGARPFSSPPPAPRRGMTMQQLFSRLTLPPLVLGLSEGAAVGTGRSSL